MRRCEYCGGPVGEREPGKGGRARIYCSKRCSRKAWHLRAADRAIVEAYDRGWRDGYNTRDHEERA